MTLFRTARTFRMALALVAALGGCATTGDVEDLDKRIDVLERDRDLLRSKLGEDYSKLEKLHTMLTEAEETLRKSGADLGNSMQRIEQDFPRFKGDVDAFDFRVNQVL